MLTKLRVDFAAPERRDGSPYTVISRIFISPHEIHKFDGDLVRNVLVKKMASINGVVEHNELELALHLANG